MRRALFGFLLITSCSFLITATGPDQCEEGSFVPRCDGSVLVTCALGVEILEDCGVLQCNAQEIRCGFCGDGIREPGFEECDDGNAVDTDACPTACQPASCGDGFVQQGVETCEPPGEGACDAECQLLCQQDIDCLDDNACTINERCLENSCVSEIAAIDDNDACTVDSCDPLTGVLHTLVDINDGDDCTDDLCDPATGVVSHPPLSNLDDDDACTIDSCDPQTGVISRTTVDTDDGNACTADSCDPALGVFHDPVSTDDGDACTVDSCDPLTGVSHTPLAQIDDGNACTADSCDPQTSAISHTGLADGTPCDADSDPGTREICLSESCAASSCGDGFADTDAAEQCDGGDLNGESCEGLGFASGSLACDAACQFDISGCQAAASCGDGVLDAGEACDDGNTSNEDSCLNSCTQASCGDGFVQSGAEACDDGNTSNEDGCLNSCTQASCGDGLVQSGVEACDDGNTSNEDGCLNSCTQASCGDGFVQSGAEACDGGDLNGESCEGLGFASGSLACDTACQLDTSACEVGPICGDGLLDAGEACDDSNLARNDGCDDQCLFEADEFILCGGPAGGNGNLDNPFNSLDAAINNNGTLDGEVIMILPQSPAACGGANVTKAVTIQGLADPADPAAPPVPLIEGGGSAALAILQNSSLRVVIQDLALRSGSAGGVVVCGQKVKLALLRTDIRNTNSAPNAVGVDCNPNSSAGDDGVLLIDQSVIHDNAGGGIRARGQCRAVIANSLFRKNGSEESSRGAVDIEGAFAQATLLFSTFDENLTNTGGAVLQCPAVGQGVVDSSIFNDNNENSIGLFPVDALCSVSFTDTFGSAPPPGAGNINADPLFTQVNNQDFHLQSGSPCINAGNPAPIPLPFDPFAIFGVDVFGHDFVGQSRPLGGSPDMGMFEEQ